MAALAVADPFVDEVQRKQRLARPRRAGDQGGAAAGHPAAEQLVQLRHAARDTAARRDLLLRGERLQPCEDLDAVRADPDAVLAAEIGRAAHLADAQRAPVERVVQLVAEVDDAVRDRELGQPLRVLGRVLADEQQHRLRMTDLACQVVDDLADLLGAREVMERLRAVDDDQRRPRLEALARDLAREGSEAVGLLGDRKVDDLE